MSFPEFGEFTFNSIQTYRRRSMYRERNLICIHWRCLHYAAGVANARISQDMGTWQAATVTQLTGFIMALVILLFVRDGSRQGLGQVKPLYLIGEPWGTHYIQ